MMMTCFIALLPKLGQTNMPPDTSIRWRVDPAVVLGEQGGDGGADVVGQAGTAERRHAGDEGVDRLLSRTAPPAKSVSIAPGAIVFAVMPRGPNSLAR